MMTLAPISLKTWFLQRFFWCQIQNHTFSLSAQVHRPPIVYIGCQLIHWLPWDFWWDPRCKNYTVSLSAQVHRLLTPGWKVVVNLVVNLPPDLSWRQLLPMVAQGKVRGLFNFCWQRSRWPSWLHGCHGCVILNWLTIKKSTRSTNLKQWTQGTKPISSQMTKNTFVRHWTWWRYHFQAKWPWPWR